MTKMRLALLVVGLWSIQGAAWDGEAMPWCWDVCNSSAHCDTDCDDGYKEGTCGQYGVCAGWPPGPCEQPSPVWQTISQTVVGGYDVCGWDSIGYSCQYVRTVRVVQQDVQACESARQANRHYCYHEYLDTYYAPDDWKACGNNWCGGSGSSCPSP